MKKRNFTSLVTVLAISVASGTLLSADTFPVVTIQDNLPWLYYDDTDTSGNEWMIRGYSEYYRLYDAQTSTANASPVLSIMHSANNTHSLEIDTSGDINLANGSVWIDKSENNVGIGTTAPDAGLHIVNTKVIVPPAPSFYTSAKAVLKLETKDGFDWSLISNWNKMNTVPATPARKNFYIKDDTANTYPFGIKGGAGSNTLFINSTSRVGIGTSSPQAKLDVKGTIKSSDKITTTWSGSNAVDDGLTTLVSLSANNVEAGKASDAGFALVNAGENFQWNFRTLEYRDAFTATKEGSGGGEFVVQSPTNDFKDAIMKVGGKIIFEGGHVVTASSRELKTDIKPLDTQAAMDAFHKLQPVSFAYKTHKDEPVVGFIAEDVPELLAMPSRKTFDSAEVVAVLTSVVKEQERSLAETRAEMEAMRAEIAELKAMKER